MPEKSDPPSMLTWNMPSQGITFPIVHHESTEAAETLVHSGHVACHWAAEVDILTAFVQRKNSRAMGPGGLCQGLR